MIPAWLKKAVLDSLRKDGKGLTKPVVKKALRRLAKPNPGPRSRRRAKVHYTPVMAMCGSARRTKGPQRTDHYPAVTCQSCRNLSFKRLFKNPADLKPVAWYIHIQKSGRGPVMLYNGRSFTNQPDDKPYPFASKAAAMYKARHLLGLHHDKLSAYKIWVSDMVYGASQERRRVNPDTRQKLDAAAQKLEDFTGHEATHVQRARARSQEKTGLVIGELDLIGYQAKREGVEGGRMTRYAHKFRKGSRPLLAVSTDGKQLHVVGGQYEFTDAGIEDR